MTLPFFLGRGDRRSPEAETIVSETAVRLGMPQLAPSGVSEKWLLEWLGDRHWMLIAEAAGLARPAFRDRSGEVVYAAFCGVSIGNARLDRVAENDDLVIESEIARVSGTQFASRHALSCAGVALGTVELASVFVRRKAEGQNRSIARVAVEGLPPMSVRPGFASVVALTQDLRAGVRTSHFGFSLDPGPALGRTDFLPCPSVDFNGAGFLYFSAFPAFVDRTEWAIFGARHPTLTTRARDIVYRGNVDPGEPLAVELLDLREDGGTIEHWCRISSNGRMLADVFTRRARN